MRTLGHVLTHILVYSLACIGAVCLMTGCQKHARNAGQESDALVGAPPSRQQDPFASRVLPPESAKAPTSGLMDLPADRSKTPRPALAKEARPTQIPESEPVAMVAPDPITPDEIKTPQGGPIQRCFSCVQICPMSDQSGNCSESKEDVICGWGTSSAQSDARKLAQAECNATLDMAREMPRFSRIDGACPAASCVPD